MSDAQYSATLLELRRVTLGGHPDRPELYADADLLEILDQFSAQADVELRRATRPAPQDRIRRRRV